jgi:multicomponent Na+:H+ antiporter subunit D
MKGIGKTMPWTMAAFVFGGLSLIGVPSTVGFISKWYLILAAIEQGWWLVAVAILLGSLLAVIYIWRIVEVAYFQDAVVDESGQVKNNEAPLSLLIPLWLIILANFYFGINASLTSGIAKQTATYLLSAN